MAGRFDNRDYILTLDPKTDYEEIVRIVGTLEYPWLIKKSLEFALFRTYAVPHTSRILAAAGQFENHGQKRYDDTTLMLSGIAERGIDSDHGRIVIESMNRLHGRWNIKNDDMLYVLSTFIFEPIRWHAKYGWRNPTENEKLANYYFWSEVGRRMGIESIPDSYEAYEAFNIAHEQKHFRYDDACRAIGLATIKVFVNWYPKPLQPIVHQGILAFMDDALLNAMGLPKPHSIVRWLCHNGLKLGGKIMRFMPPRSKPYLYTQEPNRTYPDGFKTEELGAKYETQQPVSGD